jgi:phytoene synthase
LVRNSARAWEPDRYLAALLAPRPARSDLIALAAFCGEVARIPLAVSEPMIGEIRLQWWRDALKSARAGAATGSPVADALWRAIERHELPDALFLSILDARSRELDPQSPADEQVLEGVLGDSEGAAFRLAARVLGVAEGAVVNDLLAAAGQAYGRVRLLRSLPASVAKGRSPALTMAPLAEVAPDWGTVARPLIDGARLWLEETRRRALTAPAAVLPAILPVALVEPYLAALERLGPDIARERADISPLTRVWRLWRASVRGRV